MKCAAWHLLKISARIFFDLWEEEFLEGEMQKRAGMITERLSRAEPVLWGAGPAAALECLLRPLVFVGLGE